GTHVNALLGKTVLAIVGCPHHLLFTAEWLIEAARLVDGQVPTFGVHAGLEPRNETLSPLRLISHPRWRFPSGGATLGVTRTTREQGPCACHNQQSQAIHLSTSSSHYTHIWPRGVPRGQHLYSVRCQPNRFTTCRQTQKN